MLEIGIFAAWHAVRIGSVLRMHKDVIAYCGNGMTESRKWVAIRYPYRDPDPAPQPRNTRRAQFHSVE